jgi:hypothetical protein
VPIPHNINPVYLWCLLWLALAAGELTGNRALIARPLDEKQLNANTYGRLWDLEQWLQRRAEMFSRDATGTENIVRDATMLKRLKQLVDEAAINYIRFRFCERCRHFADVLIYVQVAAALGTALATFLDAPQSEVRSGGVCAAILLTALLMILAGWALMVQTKIQLS